jgi:hypothetical protein
MDMDLGLVLVGPRRMSDGRPISILTKLNQPTNRAPPFLAFFARLSVRKVQKRPQNISQNINVKNFLRFCKFVNYKKY